ncbi:MAG: glycerol-3-phosphate dehydrogenase [Marinobacter sp.]|nr:glycerol-3-phosphate dehydrogenase [Marinobacter sp.]
MDKGTPTYQLNETYDVLVIGGGINGTGIAADASGRGLSVLLCEQGDLGGATSSASSKLVHGGLRYLEHYEFRLVREALAEREVLLKVAPHLVRPLRFTLPHLPHLRPGWMIRSGLFLYDNLADRETLPASRKQRFGVSSPLKPHIRKGYSYSDCWVDDARLVIANAQAAREQGARILRNTRCIRALRVADDGLWQVTLQQAGSDTTQTVRARSLVNAAGPWAARLFDTALEQTSPHQVRLIKGSHIVVPRFTEGEGAFILQNSDKRIVFVLPFEEDFNLIGTTDKEYRGDPAKVAIDQDEIDYLLGVVNNHFIRQLTPADIVHTYSGVRPLLDDESSDPSAITRDYTLTLDRGEGEQSAPLLSVFGGKITTYRKLAVAAVNKLQCQFPALPPSHTAQRPLPGATAELTQQGAILALLQKLYPQLPATMLRRFSRSYGVLAIRILGKARTTDELGRHFGDTLYETEVNYLRQEEWAITAEDILWRRSKLGLRLDTQQQTALTAWLEQQPAAQRTVA